MDTPTTSPTRPAWAKEKAMLHDRYVWTDHVHYAYLETPHDLNKLDRAEMHQMRAAHN